LGALTEAEAVEVFVEQIEGLKAGGADVAWIETMSAPEEMRAAATAAARAGMRFTITASFDTAGCTMMGNAPAPLASFLTALSPAPCAIGSNCGVGASDLIVSTLSITAEYPDAVVVAKANCGIPRVSGDKVEYTGTPELMADYARMALDAGARIIGGCCGTSPEHLAAMRRALDGYTRRSRPELADIVARIGPLVAPPKPDGVAPQRRNRRRGAT
jgi:5-methyltetrahydrofolate--homocysteine methyltransferase